jgi:hypothetical protein
MQTRSVIRCWPALLSLCVAAACTRHKDAALSGADDADAPTDHSAPSDDASVEPPGADASRGDDASTAGDPGDAPALDDREASATPTADADAASEDTGADGAPSEIIAGTPYDVAAALGDPPASHTFVLFGKQTVYMSHLPEWFPPHDFQAEVAITLDANARAAYLQDRADSGSLLYSTIPADFVLASLVSPDAGSFAIGASLYRGDAETNGTLIVLSSTISAPRALHFRHLDAATPRPAEAAYLIFGAPDEAYMLHLFTTQPDFDQILAVTLPPELATDPRLASGIQVRLPGRDPTLPLDAGSTPQVRVADTTQVFTVTVVADIWRDLSDLP